MKSENFFLNGLLGTFLDSGTGGCCLLCPLVGLEQSIKYVVDYHPTKRDIKHKGVMCMYLYNVYVFH